MKNVTLNHYQMLSLLEDKELTFENFDNILEISENEIRLNLNGKIYKLLNANMTFEKQEIESNHSVRSIRRLLCEYLNLEAKEVIIKSVDDMEFVFHIRICPTLEVPILICDKFSAISNTKEMCNFETKPDAEHIGIYRRLGNSDYYFRWLGDDV